MLAQLRSLANKTIAKNDQVERGNDSDMFVPDIAKANIEAKRAMQELLETEYADANKAPAQLFPQRDWDEYRNNGTKYANEKITAIEKAFPNLCSLYHLSLAEKRVFDNHDSSEKIKRDCLTDPRVHFNEGKRAMKETLDNNHGDLIHGTNSTNLQVLQIRRDAIQSVAIEASDALRDGKVPANSLEIYNVDPPREFISGARSAIAEWSIKHNHVVLEAIRKQEDRQANKKPDCLSSKEEREQIKKDKVIVRSDRYYKMRTALEKQLNNPLIEKMSLEDQRTLISNICIQAASKGNFLKNAANTKEERDAVKEFQTEHRARIDTEITNRDKGGAQVREQIDPVVFEYGRKTMHDGMTARFSGDAQRLGMPTDEYLLIFCNDKIREDIVQAATFVTDKHEYPLPNGSNMSTSFYPSLLPIPHSDKVSFDSGLRKGCRELLGENNRRQDLSKEITSKVVGTEIIEATLKGRSAGASLQHVADHQGESTYVGPIVAETENFAIQRVGLDTTIRHEKNDLIKNVPVGSNLSISYSNGRVYIEPNKELLQKVKTREDTSLRNNSRERQLTFGM